MKILLTGGAGFIGSHLAKRLVSLNHQVTVLDNFESGRLENLKEIKQKIIIIEDDITNTKSLTQSLNKIDAIFHLAAKVTVTESFHNKRVFENVNAQATLDLLKAAQKSHVKKLIFASSAAVYGNSKTLPICETTSTKPISPLGKTKLEAERYCEEFQEKGLNIAVLRFFNAYGPGQNPIHGNVAASFINNLLTNNPPVVYGTGNQTRDFIYIDDVVDACLATMQKNTKDHFIFNIGTGRETGIKLLFKKLARITGRREKVKYLPPRKGDIKRSVACICEAGKYLKFKSRVSLEEGLLRTISWIKAVQ